MLGQIIKKRQKNNKKIFKIKKNGTILASEKLVY